MQYSVGKCVHSDTHQYRASDLLRREYHACYVMSLKELPVIR